MSLPDHNVRVCRTGPLMCDFKAKSSRCRLEWLLREEFTDEHKITWLKNTGKYKPVAEKTPRSKGQVKSAGRPHDPELDQEKPDCQELPRNPLSRTAKTKLNSPEERITRNLARKSLTARNCPETHCQ